MQHIYVSNYLTIYEYTYMCVCTHTRESKSEISSRRLGTVRIIIYLFYLALLRLLPL